MYAPFFPILLTLCVECFVRKYMYAHFYALVSLRIFQKMGKSSSSS